MLKKQTNFRVIFFRNEPSHADQNLLLCKNIDEDFSKVI